MDLAPVSLLRSFGSDGVVDEVCLSARVAVEHVTHTLSSSSLENEFFRANQQPHN